MTKAEERFHATDRLLRAARCNYGDAIIEELGKGGDPNAKDKNMTPLMLAIIEAGRKGASDELEGIFALIADPRTDLSIRDGRGWKASDYAEQTPFHAQILPAMDAAQKKKNNNFVVAAAQNLTQRYRNRARCNDPKRRFG